jgi:hypothetical protein
MRKIFSCVAMALFLFVSVTVFGGCSNSQGSSAGPSAEVQSNVVDVSMNSILQGTRVDGTEFEILKINKEEVKYVMHPSVKKVVKGVEYDAWPIKIDGSGVVRHRLFRWTTYYVKMSYTAYCYVDSVGENKIIIENVQLDEKKI